MVAAVRLLALDFDGVISNSAPEAFVVALRCFALMRADAGLAGEAAQLSPPSGVTAGLAPGPALAPTSSAVREHPRYAAFLELMPLGNRAEDYGVVLSAIEAGRGLPDQEAYDVYRDELDPVWLRSYHERFYRVRADLVKADPAGWNALTEPYAGFLDVLRRRASDALLCIATAKDRGSVRQLLHAYGIDDLFPDDRVLDKETGVRKSEHLAELQRQHEIPYPEMTFVDDKPSHLADVGTLGVRCALAAWGFNGSREAERARAGGHLVCSQEDVERQLYEPAAQPDRSGP
jgi:phosphoglycolate phosphatase-like HAD superfamily hydrolase